MKRIFTFLCVCLVAMLVSAEPIHVLSNQKVASGWNAQFSADATEVLYVDNEIDEVPEQLTLQSALSSATIASGDPLGVNDALNATYAQGDLRVENEDLKMVLYRNGERRVLTPHGSDVNYVWMSLSPDRSRILFNTKHGTAICDLEGRELINLGTLDAPVWYGNDYVVGMFDAHDGHSFTGSAIVIRSVDGHQTQMLTDMREFGMYPAVSPATGHIAYNTLSGDVRLMQIDRLADHSLVDATPAQLKARRVEPKARRKMPAAGNRQPSEVKIYINPGHGGHGSNDRGITIYPFASGDPEGFWESNSNLDKGLKLEELLLAEGFQVMMSRHTNNDGGGNDADVLKTWLNSGKITQAQYDDMLLNGDDRSLSAIVAEANAYGADFMLSIHSNAGGPSNYVLELYSGQDKDDTRTYRNPAPRQDESRAISTIIANNLVDNKITNWSPASRAAGWVVGDKTFGYTIMGGWGDGYGVLRRLAVPGVISEGCMHDYTPETYRLMNMDYKWKEAWYFTKSFLEYFCGKQMPTGVVGGQVRDWYKKLEFPSIKSQIGTRDELLPILGAKVQLLKDGAVVDTYTTDSLYNGVFFFWNVEPGTYTLHVEAEHYYPMDQEISVEKNKITYQDMLINAKRETRPVVLNYSPAPKEITDSVDVATDIVLNFNWDMKAQETEAAFSISPEVEGTILFENSYRTLRFHPKRMLEKGTEYTVTLAKTACHPDYTFPNTLEEDFVFRFRTKNRPSLRLMQSYPAVGQTEVPLRPSFILIFDEKVKTTTVKNNLKVVDADGKEMAINTRLMKYNKVDNMGSVSFELTDALMPDNDYTLIIGKDIQDVIGVYHNDDTPITFHTTADKQQPEGVMLSDCEQLLFAYDADNSLNMSNASVFLNKERKYAGAAANELKYKFGDNDAFVRYHYIGETLINGNSNCRLGMYVFGDFSGNELQAVWDASGDIQYTPITTIDFAGWHYEEADLSQMPEGVDYQFMGLRLIHHDGLLSGEGSISVDNLYFMRQEFTSVDILRAGEVMAYPNPASTTINVAGITPQTQLRLISLDGKLLQTGRGNAMNIEEINNGIYMLEVITNDEVFTLRVIINHK